MIDKYINFPLPNCVFIDYVAAVTIGVAVAAAADLHVGADHVNLFDLL